MLWRQSYFTLSSLFITVSIIIFDRLRAIYVVVIFYVWVVFLHCFFSSFGCRFFLIACIASWKVIRLQNLLMIFVALCAFVMAWFIKIHVCLVWIKIAISLNGFFETPAFWALRYKKVVRIKILNDIRDRSVNIHNY